MSNSLNLMLNELRRDDAKGLLTTDKHAAYRLNVWRKALEPFADQVAHWSVVQKHELVAAMKVININKWLDRHGIVHNGACHIFEILTRAKSGRAKGDEARKLIMEAVNDPAVITAMNDLKLNPLTKSAVGRVKNSLMNDMKYRPNKTASLMLDAILLTGMFEAANSCKGCNRSEGK